MGTTSPSGRAEVAFALGSTSGGLGTFGSVTDIGNGTYSATFTSTIAGSNTVTATINGQAVTSPAPAIAVAPGAFDAANSLVTLSAPAIQLGGVATITVQARDAAGNGDPTGVSTPVITLGGSGVAGTLSSVTNDGKGVYTATLAGTTDGSNTIIAAIDGEDIGTGSPPTIAVTGAAVSLAKTKLAMTSNSVAAGNFTIITLQAEGREGAGDGGRAFGRLRVGQQRERGPGGFRSNHR